MKLVGYRMGWTSKSTSMGHSGYYGQTSGRYGNNSHIRKGSNLAGLQTHDSYKLSAGGSVGVRSPIKSPMSPWNDKQMPLSPLQQQQYPQSPLGRANNNVDNDRGSDTSGEEHDGVRYIIQGGPPPPTPPSRTDSYDYDVGAGSGSGGFVLSHPRPVMKKNSAACFGAANTSSEELRRPASLT